jgi:RNA polymerase sigma factor (sigma-70 family)
MTPGVCFFADSKSPDSPGGNAGEEAGTVEIIPSGNAVDRGPGDEELLAMVRSGDPDAFAVLYSRHVQAVLRYARKCSRRHAEDLCAEAFTATLRAIRSGGGPSGSLRPYLAAAIRHTAAVWSRQDWTVSPVGELADLPEAASEADPLLSLAERALVVQAFNSLPERWREILKHTVIDARSAISAAKLLRIDPPAARSLAYRAREGLRKAYLQAHVAYVSSAACKPFAANLGAFARQRLGSRRAANLRRHLAMCRDCSRLFDLLREIEQCLSCGCRRPRPKTRRAPN